MHREINEKGPIALTALLLVVFMLWGIFATGKPAAAEEYRAMEAIRLTAEVDFAEVEFRTSDFPDITAVYDKEHYDVCLSQEGTDWTVTIDGTKSKDKAKDEEEGRGSVILYLPEFYCDALLLDADNSQIDMNQIPPGNIQIAAWRSAFKVKLGEDFTGGFTGELRSCDMDLVSMDSYQSSRTNLRWEAPEETSSVVYPWFFEASEEEKNLYTYTGEVVERTIDITVKESGDVVLK